MKPDGPIVITGFMGCGKTEVAHALARRLQVTLVDLDDRIAEQQGRTAAQLIVENGEAAFRSIETKALSQLLEGRSAGVIALGGGAWITEANRKLISDHGGCSVWLDVSFEVCWKRIEASEEDRPLGRTREQAQELYHLRQPIYELASVHIEILAQDTLDSILDRIEGSLQKCHN